MPHEIDYKKFQAKLNAYCPDSPLTEDEAAAAYRNLGEFACWLVRVNKRVKIVPMEDLAPTGLHPTSNNHSQEPPKAS
ncbi:MAG: hypothetical protein WCD70_06985 [Alphaproteobacteria bacterium]